MYGSTSSTSKASVPTLSSPSALGVNIKLNPFHRFLPLLVVFLCVTFGLIFYGRHPDILPNRLNDNFDDATLSSSSCDVGLPHKGISGYFNLPGTGIRYFYYFASAKDKPMKDAPLVLWMSGGPGCSSLLAAMMENGPCRVAREESGETKAHPNEYSWNGEANVIWVDQPSGVGFSYDESGAEEALMFSHDSVANNMLAFLNRWQERFPESHNGELYIFAESFGGHYAPAVGRRYFDAEKIGMAPKNLKLKGIGVGNGLTNPAVQYKYTAEFAYKNTYGIQAISEKDYKNATEIYLPECEAKIKACNDPLDFSITNCADAFVYCNSYLYAGYVKSGRNIYDVRKFGNFDDDMHAVTEFVSSGRVRKALDTLSPTEFTACNMHVYMKFLFDWMKEYDKALPAMLHEGINILVYAGDADFICNWMGNRAWVEEMEWKGKKAFNEAEEKSFTLKDGKEYGIGKSAKHGKDGGLLTFLRIYEASHMAPRDQPEATREMLNRFMKDNGKIV